MKTTRLYWTVVLGISFAPMLSAQVQTIVPPVVPGAKPVSVEHIRIHGTALEGNLEGDAVDRDVIVFLPPSYEKEKHRRYPVVYALHGYSIGAEQWTHEIHVPQTVEGAYAQGAQEMIVVLPDSKTVHNGSMYSSSVTTGDFEKFISHDVVAHIDGHYRTIPDRMSRGLVGHSMGGYGASRIGMKHPDVFGSLYIMSPCCMSARPGGPPNSELEKTLEAVKTQADSEKLPFFASGKVINDLEEGARVAVRTEKKDPRDFALWKVDQKHLMQWDPHSPAGWQAEDWERFRRLVPGGVDARIRPGFPGWHIECSAMSRALLGPVIDLHTGGEDNIFPHHECEIAQSFGAATESSPPESFARYWVHGRHLLVDNKKMSKRDGTFFTVRDLMNPATSKRPDLAARLAEESASPTDAYLPASSDMR